MGGAIHDCRRTYVKLREVVGQRECEDLRGGKYLIISALSYNPPYKPPYK
jgi:hypothetical protein